MKTTHITAFQRAIAYVLLVGELLTSCTWNTTVLPNKQQEGSIQPTLYSSNIEEGTKDPQLTMITPEATAQQQDSKTHAEDSSYAQGLCCVSKEQA